MTVDEPDYDACPDESLPYEDLKSFTDMLDRFEARGLRGFFCHWDYCASITTSFNYRTAAGRVLFGVYERLLKGVAVPSDEDVLALIKAEAAAHSSSRKAWP